MKYKERLPHSTLQEYVKCFWILEKEYTSEQPFEEVIPDACVELILNFGDPYLLKSAEGLPNRELPPAFLVGLQNKPLIFSCSGTVKIVATRFYAWGTQPFIDFQQQTAGKVALVLSREWQELCDILKPNIQSDNYETAIAKVEDFLISKLLIATCDLKQIQIAARMLYREKGQFRVSELADYCNMSTRQLQRRFQKVVGVSPKTLARTIRFEEIRKRLMFNPHTNLTELAHEFGYTDQAHFIHDFKEFTDKTPGEFSTEMHAVQTLFRDQQNVVFLQFPAPEST